MGQRADVDGDDAELLCPVELDRITEQAEPRIVDEVLDLHTFLNQRRGDFVAGLGVFEVARNQNRRGTASGDDFSSQGQEAIPAPADKGEPMAVRCENARKFRAYSRRRTGN